MPRKVFITKQIIRLLFSKPMIAYIYIRERERERERDENKLGKGKEF